MHDMKILITGTRNLAAAIADSFKDHEVTMVDRSQGRDIAQIQSWGFHYLDYDMAINCAYFPWAQISFLEFFHEHWRDDASKTIVSIGGKVITQRRTPPEKDQEYWPYREHKLALQHAHDTMSRISKCRMKICNPGAFNRYGTEPDPTKLDILYLSQRIHDLIQDPHLQRLDLWV